MTEERKVHPDCINSSNPYHECVEYCFRKIAEVKAQTDKSEIVPSNAGALMNNASAALSKRRKPSGKGKKSSASAPPTETIAAPSPTNKKMPLPRHSLEEQAPKRTAMPTEPQEFWTRTYGAEVRITSPEVQQDIRQGFLLSANQVELSQKSTTELIEEALQLLGMALPSLSILHARAVELAHWEQSKSSLDKQLEETQATLKSMQECYNKEKELKEEWKKKASEYKNSVAKEREAREEVERQNAQLKAELEKVNNDAETSMKEAATLYAACGFAYGDRLIAHALEKCPEADFNFDSIPFPKAEEVEIPAEED